MLEHGVPLQLSPRVRRIVAPNPGVMTGPGTNTYLVGDDEVAVIDPGPAIASHIDAILAAAGGRLRWIFCTHTHRDHSPAALPLAEASGAQVLGALPEDRIAQDETFRPDLELRQDDLFQTGEFRLRAVHTPGHVSNHFCFLLEEEGMLFAGDHVMNGSTVVIIPPSGDMQAYIASLQRLLQYPLRSIAPGHGDLIRDAQAEIEGLVAHRLKREDKVLAGLHTTGRCHVNELVQVVYDDVDSSLHKIAVLSLTAHLIKLRQEGRVVLCSVEEHWEITTEGGPGSR
ncbi:MBL fold metallo-hydrolase [Haliea sp. E17]|uniref:MBL fold metallo-hydrolase n=1 Tax=Haliea sp. E17 TaxID=3401576 RepID=UPI003AB0DD16